HLRGVLPGVLEDVGVGPLALGAVEAVLRAQAALHVDQVVQLDPVTEELAPYAPDRRDEFERARVGDAEHRTGLVPGRRLPAHRLGHDRIHEIVHVASLPCRDRGAEQPPAQQGGPWLVDAVYLTPTRDSAAQEGQLLAALGR